MRRRTFKGTSRPGWTDWQTMLPDDRVGAAYCRIKLTKKRGTKRWGRVCWNKAEVQQICPSINGRIVRCMECFLEKFPKFRKKAVTT